MFIPMRLGFLFLDLPGPDEKAREAQRAFDAQVLFHLQFLDIKLKGPDFAEAKFSKRFPHGFYVIQNGGKYSKEAARVQFQVQCLDGLARVLKVEKYGIKAASLEYLP